MATRLYFPSSGTAAVTPSTWNFGAQINPLTLPGSRSKTATALTTKTEATGTTNPTARAMLRYVYGPLAAQTISGTIKGQMRWSESNAGANATPAIAVKIIQPGGADRAVLLAQTASTNTASTPPEMATTDTNRKFLNSANSAAITLTSQSATAGDYLVIEIGFRSATGTTRNISLRYGDTGATDLAEDDTTTTDNVPWVEFSANIGFIVAGTGSASGLGAATAVGASTAVSSGSATGAGSASGAGAAIVEGAGSASGTSTVSGSSSAGSTVTATGSSSAVSSALATGSSVAASAGSAAGLGSGSGIGSSSASAAGSAAASGSAIGVGAANALATAAATATTSVVATGRSTVASVGSSASVSTAIAASNLIATYTATGSASGTSTAFAVGGYYSPSTPFILTGNLFGVGL